ncbi:hypothetical protein E2I00_019556, partial [Balaenoptera physalus]
GDAECGYSKRTEKLCAEAQENGKASTDSRREGPAAEQPGWLAAANVPSETVCTRRPCALGDRVPSETVCLWSPCALGGRVPVEPLCPRRPCTPGDRPCTLGDRCPRRPCALGDLVPGELDGDNEALSPSSDLSWPVKWKAQQGPAQCGFAMETSTPDLLVLEATPPLEQVKTQQLASEVRGRLLLGSGAARP